MKDIEKAAKLLANMKYTDPSTSSLYGFNYEGMREGAELVLTSGGKELRRITLPSFVINYLHGFLEMDDPEHPDLYPNVLCDAVMLEAMLVAFKLRKRDLRDHIADLLYEECGGREKSSKLTFVPSV